MWSNIFTKKLQENELYKLVVSKLENVEARLLHIDDDFAKTSFANDLVTSIATMTKTVYSLVQSHINTQKQLVALTIQVNALTQVVNITTPCVDILAEEFAANHTTIKMPEPGTKVKKEPDQSN